MADAWLPGAGRIPVCQDGGRLKGGAPRVVWFTSENDPRRVSARSAACDLARQGRPPHLVWNPVTGEIVQLLPITRAACLLAEPVRTEGRTCVQIVVIGLAREPFTAGPLNGLDRIMRWLDSWSVPRRWPAGPPLPSPQSYHSSRERRSWARGGHFGASQVPESMLPDPGNLDIHRITGGGDSPVVDVPRPRTPIGEQTDAPAALIPHRLPRPTAEPVLTPGAV